MFYGDVCVIVTKQGVIIDAKNEFGVATGQRPLLV